MTKIDKVMIVWFILIALLTGISIGLLIGQIYFG